jgi:hypothetical protein
VNKSKICDYFYNVLVAREEKNKKISKEENQTEILSERKTAMTWKNTMMLKRKKKEKTKKFGK